MVKKILIAVAVLANTATAQPTLTSSCSPIAGFSNVYHACDSVGPGPGGANVTWDFHGLVSTGDVTGTYAACPAGPGCGTYPGSDLVYSNTQASYHLYYVSNASKFSVNGTDLPQPVVYSDPEDWLRFPFTFNDHFIDSFRASFVSASYTYDRSGTSSDTADGWGTLITPTDTFHNVLRIHKVQEYRDSNLSFPVASHYHDDIYQWYMPGRRDLIMDITLPITLNGNPAGPTLVSYTSGGNTGTDELQRLKSGIAITPNPAKDKINIRLTEPTNEPLMVSLTDMLGKTIASKSYDTQTMQACSFETAGLRPGLYFVYIHTAKGTITRKVEIL